MRRALLLAALSLAACREEPSFDERYAEAEAHIAEKAAAIDSDLTKAGAAPDAASETR